MSQTYIQVPLLYNEISVPFWIYTYRLLLSLGLKTLKIINLKLLFYLLCYRLKQGNALFLRSFKYNHNMFR